MLDNCKDSGNLASSRKPAAGLAQRAPRGTGQVHGDRRHPRPQTSPERHQRGIERLCQLLVDYVSAGHFEVFLALQKEAEIFADGSGEVADD